MKTYHAGLLKLLAVLVIFTSPLQSTADELIKVQAKPLDATTLDHKTSKQKHKTKVIKDPPATPQPRKLDLSVPLNDINTTDTQNSPPQAKNLFTPDTKKKQPVELGGDLLMSIEPEAEKKKSVDGAGIVINVKP